MLPETVWTGRSSRRLYTHWSCYYVMLEAHFLNGDPSVGRARKNCVCVVRQGEVQKTKIRARKRTIETVFWADRRGTKQEPPMQTNSSPTHDRSGANRQTNVIPVQESSKRRFGYSSRNKNKSKEESDRLS